MPTFSDFRTAAAHYIARGWPVFPVHAIVMHGGCTCGDPECDKPGKHPATSHGHLDATLDITLIDSLWPEYVRRNIGIATGLKSQLVVIDIDPRHGGMDAWDEFESMFEDQFATHTVATGGGGLHLYYHIDHHVPTIPNLIRGVDLKADGGYVIAPPSTHNSGGQYETRFDNELMPLPPSILDIIQTGKRPEGLRHTPSGDVTGIGMSAERQREIMADPSLLGPGERDTFFTFTARDLRRADTSFEDTVIQLANVYDRMSNPRDDFFSQEQLIAKVRRAFEQVDPAPTRENREIASRLIASMQYVEDATSAETTLVEEDPEHEHKELVPLKRVLTQPDSYTFPVAIWEHWNGELPVPWQANDLGVAWLAGLQWGHRLRYDLDREAWLFYDDETKLWTEKANHEAYRLIIQTVLSIERIIAKDQDDDLQEQFIKLSHQYGNHSKMKNVLQTLANLPGVSINHDELNVFDGKLPVRNGVLEPDAVEDVGPTFQPFEQIPFRGHEPEDLFTRHVNMDYDPDAFSPFWDQAIRDWFPDQEVREFVQRLMGYALFGEGQEKILIVGYGKKHSGKSAFVTNVEALFGSFASALNASDVTRDRRTPQDDSGKGFNLAHLPGAKLITVAETAPNMSYNTELLKLLSSGGEDPIRASFKFKDFFTFRNKGLVFMMTNHLPSNEVLDEALWSRLVIVPFTASFPPGAAHTIGLNEVKRLIQAESDGALRWFLDGYEAYKRMGLAIPEPVRRLTEKTQVGENWLAAYIGARFNVDPDAKALCKSVYPDYVKWAQTGMVDAPVGKREFNRLLKERFDLRRGTQGAFYFYGFELRPVEMPTPAEVASQLEES